MGRGERWRAMSGKVMDAHHCITKCSNIYFMTHYRWVRLDTTGSFYLVFRCAEAYNHLVQIWYSLIFNGLFTWLALGWGWGPRNSAFGLEVVGWRKGRKRQRKAEKGRKRWDVGRKASLQRISENGRAGR